MRKRKEPNMYGLNKSAVAAVPIADSISIIGKRPIHCGRIGRKVAKIWSFFENRQLKKQDVLKIGNFGNADCRFHYRKKYDKDN